MISESYSLTRWLISAILGARSLKQDGRREKLSMMSLECWFFFSEGAKLFWSRLFSFLKRLVTEVWRGACGTAPPCSKSNDFA